jgi:hypothetical protein
VLPWVGPSAFQTASDTLSDVIDTERKRRLQEREQTRADEYLKVAKAGEARAEGADTRERVRQGFFTPGEVADRMLGEGAPTPNVQTTESRQPFDERPMVSSRQPWDEQPPAGVLAQKPDLSQAIAQARQARAATTLPTATATGQPAHTPSASAPSHGEVNLTRAGGMIYMPQFGEAAFHTRLEEEIYDHRTAVQEAHRAAERERSITDIMGALKVDRGTAAGIADKSLSATDVMGAQRGEVHTDASGRVWQFNSRTKTWDPALTAGGRQMTGHVPNEAGAFGGVRASVLGRAIDDERLALTQAEGEVNKRLAAAKGAGGTAFGKDPNTGLQVIKPIDAPADTASTMNLVRQHRDRLEKLMGQQNQELGIPPNVPAPMPRTTPSPPASPLRQLYDQATGKGAAPAGGAPNVADERAKAARAIQNGKNPDAVKALYKQRTGEDY